MTSISTIQQNHYVLTHSLLVLDPFAVDKSEQEGLIHIRIQQRNGRKTLTTVQGISDKYDKKKLVKYFKKVCPK